MKPQPWICLAAVLGCNEYDLNNKPPENDDTPQETGIETEPPEFPGILVYCTDDPDCAFLDFGYVAQNCSSDWLQVTVENSGAGDLEVTNVGITGSGKGAFETDASFPFTLEPDELNSFRVRFTPTALVTYEPQVIVTSNDPETPTAGLDMLGIGSEYPIYEQYFQQANLQSVDVLWVVDNSGSMTEEINLVKEHFRYFIDEFVIIGLDYHMAAINHDMDNPADQGRMQGEPKVLSSDMDPGDVVAEWIATIDEIYARKGSGSEQGFDTSQAALTEPLLSGANADFLRDYDDDGNEVGLAIIALTDEEEGSSTTAQNYASWLNGMKSTPEKSSYSAICGDAEFMGCTNVAAGTSAMGGYKHIEATDLTGGFWASICTDDFTEALQFISMTAAGMLVEFHLDETPTSVSSMTVQVDGQDVAYYSAVSGDGWKYEPDPNTVVFHGDSVPEAGASIYISYAYDSGCGN